MFDTESRLRAVEAKRSTKSVDELLKQAPWPANSTQHRQIRARLAEMPETCRRTYLRAVLGRSMAAAVKAHCMECVCWDRREVALCTALACALYPYRPFVSPEKTPAKVAGVAGGAA